MELTIRLPKPHAKQQAFRASPAKRKVIVAGRRGGKTTGAGQIAVEGFLAGRRVLEAAPTEDQTSAFWDFCKRALQEPIDAGIIYKNETKRLLEMPGHSARIRCKTAFDADTLRGDYADLLILDEYSLMDPTTWTEVGAPMLLDNNGDAIFIFTPKRRNHAYHTYQRAQSDTTGRWAAWHFTSLDNPHLSPEALAEITGDMTEDAYRQEILAEFLEGSGAVFRHIRARATATRVAPYAGDFAMGVDWAQQHDYTVLTVIDTATRRMVDMDRFNKVDWALQRQRLVTMQERWKCRQIVAEHNSIGSPNIEALQREGLPVTPFETTATSKPPLIESLVLAFERGEIEILDNPVLVGELEAYERTVSPQTGRSRYGAPTGLFDDCVMSLALAWHGVNAPTVRVSWL